MAKIGKLLSDAHETELAVDLLARIRTSSEWLNPINFLEKIFSSKDSPYHFFVLESAEARRNPGAALTVPLLPRVLLSKVVEALDLHDLSRPGYMAHLTVRHFSLGRVSPEEHQRILGEDHGAIDIHDVKPILFDRLAHFEKQGICFGSLGIFDYNELPSIIKGGPEKYYVYRLLTPAGQVFYVGKGCGKRLMEHEQELDSSYFKVHTNWKKLNKIAQIVLSNKKIRYVIDSWHKCEESALLREDELILINERANPFLFTNSNGQRWRGRPSEAFIKLREVRGLKPFSTHLTSR